MISNLMPTICLFPPFPSWLVEPTPFPYLLFLNLEKKEQKDDVQYAYVLSNVLIAHLFILPQMIRVSNIMKILHFSMSLKTMI